MLGVLAMASGEARSQIATEVVATNAELAAASTARYGGVWRLDYMAGTGAPLLFYIKAGDACPGKAAVFTGLLAAGKQNALTVSAVISGSLRVGLPLVGPGISPGTVITGYGSGLGGVGTYTVNNPLTIASETITAPGDGGSCIPSGDGKSWRASFPPSGIDTREFGTAAAADAITNTAALQSASAAASNVALGMKLLVAGGNLNVNPASVTPAGVVTAGIDFYQGMTVVFSPGTCFLSNGNGTVIGSRASPGAPIGASNADHLTIKRRCVDMRNHDGAAFLNRGGLWLADIDGPQTRNPGAGNFTDAAAITDTGTTAKNSTTISGLTRQAGGLYDTYPRYAYIGMQVNDGKGCIRPGTYVAAVERGGRLTLSQKTNDSPGCGAGAALSFYPVLPDAADLWLGYQGIQGAYYGRADRPLSKIYLERKADGFAGSTLTFTEGGVDGIKPPSSVGASAVWSAANGGQAVFTLSSPRVIAAGQLVCTSGFSVAAYDHLCAPAARGTVGATVVLPLVRASDPGAATGGTLWWGGSLAVDETTPGNATDAPSFVVGIDATGKSVTLNAAKAAAGPSDIWAFTTGGVGVWAGSTGSDSNPNALTVTGGSLMGYQIGLANYNGDAFHVVGTDVSYAGYGAVSGGSGHGVAGSVRDEATGFRAEGFYAEFMAQGPAVWFTRDAQYGCVDYCTDSLRGFVGYSGFGSARVIDNGSNNRALAPFGAAGRWTPTVIGETTRGSLAVAVNFARYLQDGKKVTAFFDVSTASAAGAPTGTVAVTLPVTAARLGNVGACFFAYADGISLDRGYTQFVGRVVGGTNHAQIRELGSNLASAGLDAANFRFGRFELIGTCEYWVGN